MTKLIVAFCNFSKAPKMYVNLSRLSCLHSHIMHAQLRCVRDYRISVCQYGGATCYSTDLHCGLSPSICGLRLTHSNKSRYVGRKRFCNRSRLRPTTEVERLRGLMFPVLNSNSVLHFNRNLLKTRRP
jgi:hypothetical protein